MDRHTLVWAHFFSLKVREETAKDTSTQEDSLGGFSRQVITVLTSGLWAHSIYVGWDASILCTRSCRPWRKCCHACKDSVSQTHALLKQRCIHWDFDRAKRGMLPFSRSPCLQQYSQYWSINHCLDNSALAKLCGSGSFSLMYCHGPPFTPFLPHPQKNWIQFLHSSDKRSLGAFYCLAQKAKKVEVRLIAFLTR